MNAADLTAKRNDAQRELGEYTASLADALSQLEHARAAFKDDPTTGNGKELVKAEDAHKLAVLAEQGAADRLNAARAALSKAEREEALAKLADLDAQSSLVAFETHIAADVQKVLELRAEIADLEQRVSQLASQFANGRRVEVLEPARKLGTRIPADYLFSEYAAARLAGRPASAGVSAFVREHREPRNFVAELVNLSARQASVREAERRKAEELEDAQFKAAQQRAAEQLTPHAQTAFPS
jgi:hypothetical protein